MRYVDQSMAPEAALRDLESADPGVRVRAADALGKLTGEEAARARQALRRRLDDDHPEVRYTVALALGELRDQEAVDALIEATEGDGHPLPRQAAVIALGLIGDARATAALARMLRDAPPDVRFQAATSLVQVNPEKAAGYLRKALKDPDPEVRAAAAAAMGDLDHGVSANGLAVLLEDPSGPVQLEAAVALARLGDTRGIGVLILAMDRPETRHLAAEMIFRCPDPAALPHLRRLSRGWLIPASAKVWMAGALLRLGDEGPDLQQRLRKSLASKNNMVRGLAIEVLGNLDHPWAREALVEFAGSREGEEWREELDEVLDGGGEGEEGNGKGKRKGKGNP